MSKSSVLDFVGEMGRGRADRDTCDQYYDDIVYELARQAVLVSSDLLNVTAETATFTLPTNALKELLVIYDTWQLTKADVRSLEWHNHAWRDLVGRPQVYITENETAHVFRVVPAPDVDNTATTFAFGEPYGRDFGAMSVAVVFTQYREALPDWLELPVALEVLGREFGRESDHRDERFAMLAHQLAELTMSMVLE